MTIKMNPQYLQFGLPNPEFNETSQTSSEEVRAVRARLLAHQNERNSINTLPPPYDRFERAADVIYESRKVFAFRSDTHLDLRISDEKILEALDEIGNDPTRKYFSI